MSKIKALHEEKRHLGQEIRRLADLANNDDHEWNGEDEQEWTRVNEAYNEKAAAIEDLQAKQEKLARAAELEDEDREVREVVGAPRKADRIPAVDRRHLQHLAVSGWIRSQGGVDATPQEQKAAEELGFSLNRREMELRLGDSRACNGKPIWSSAGGVTAETRDQTVGTDSEGGYTVPTGFIPELERRMLAFNGPMQVSRVIRTDSGNTITMPTVDDTSNTGSSNVAEAATTTETAVAFGEVQLDAYKYSSDLVLVTQELLEDTGINLVAELVDIMGERLGRATAAAFTTGTGSSQAQGVVTGSSAGKTAASATAIAADEIKDLVHSLDPSYRAMSSTGFMMHDNILLVVRKLVDGSSRYLWQDSIQLGTPDRLEGYPVTINQNMASAVATTNKTILFGAFEKFLIRQVRGVRTYRLDELYRVSADSSGFVAFVRADSVVSQSNAIKHLVQA